MAKKKRLKKRNNSPFRRFIICGIAVIIVLSFINYFNVGKNNNYKPLRSTSAQNLKIEATPTATPSSTPQINKYQYQTPQGKNLRVPILTYHYISTADPKDKARQNLSVPAEVFDNQMAYLAQNGYQTISLDELQSAFYKGGQLPAKPIIITLDDGYADAYINAFPILKKYNFKATMLIITSFVGTSPYLNWDQIKEMQGSGLISFASHSKNHSWLLGLSQSELDDQIIGSKKVLEEHLGIPVNWFGYPFGAFNNSVVSTVKKAGYIGAVSTLLGPWNNQSEIYSLRRLKIGNVPAKIFAETISK